jgi:ABC-type multidrug transport system fused ATPase/permease subunit
VERSELGRSDATDEEVRRAAEHALAHEIVSALPEGYATIVGERGAKLSGGQRQRIALARAVLKDRSRGRDRPS